MKVAFSELYVCSTQCSIRSRPAVTPEELQMGGRVDWSSTQRACGTQVVLSPAFTAFGHDVLFVVAFLPFMMPALAAKAEPVQIVRICLTFGAVLEIYSSVAFRVGLRQPGPPARINTSNSGAVANVCVGGSTGYTEELKGFIETIDGSEVTGSIVSAIKAMSIL